MTISIGILAHNEERYIARTIKSLLEQDIFLAAKEPIEIIVVANGCVDATSAEAEAALSKTQAALNYRYKVCDVAEADKSNSWNIFIHRESDQAAQVYFLLDADILFGDTDTLSSLRQCLQAHPEVMVATDTPVKKFTENSGLFSLKPLINRMAGSATDGEKAISGQLYAARGDWLRAITMPRGIIVDDGYLRAMTLTNSFQENENFDRILRTPGAKHFYEAYTSVGEIYRYERRQAVGTTLNKHIYTKINEWIRQGKDVQAEIAALNASRPEWVEALLAQAIEGKGPILTPKNYLTRRLLFFKNYSLKKLFLTPVALAALAFDFVVAMDASAQLRKRSNGKRWDTIRQF